MENFIKTSKRNSKGNSKRDYEKAETIRRKKVRTNKYGF